MLSCPEPGVALGVWWASCRSVCNVVVCSAVVADVDVGTGKMILEDDVVSDADDEGMEDTEEDDDNDADDVVLNLDDAIVLLRLSQATGHSSRMGGGRYSPLASPPPKRRN